MSLIPTPYPDPETQMDTLAEDIYTFMTAQPIIPADKDQAKIEAKKRIRKQMELTFQYMIHYMKLKDISIELDTGNTTIETFAAGAGDSHVPPTPTDLMAGIYPATGSIKLKKLLTGTQDNPGTGLVE